MALPARQFFAAFLACLALPVLAGTPVVTLDPPDTSDVPPSFPVGKTLIFPITGSDSAGLPLSFSVTSSNPKILVRAKTGNPALRLTVDYGGAQSGTMVFQLFRDWAPVTAGFIGGFAQAAFYNSLMFHRILPGFIIQGGDPLGTGLGGPGMTGNDPNTAFRFETERNPALIFSGRGQLAMANSGVDPVDDSATNGSQFFVSLDQLRAPTAANPTNLDFQYTIFGQLLRGWDTLAGIAGVPLQDPTAGVPANPVTITNADVEPDDHDAVLVISAKAAGAATITVTASDGGGGVATRTFPVSAVADTVNDPPFFAPIAPAVIPIHTELDLPLGAYDLESDYIFFDDDGFLLGGANAQAKFSSGNTLAVFGNAGFSGQVILGVHLAQFDMSTGMAEPAADPEPVVVGIGERAVRPEPVPVYGAPAQSLTNVQVGTLNDLDPAGTAGNFTATINWGDGTPVTAGNLAADLSQPGLGHYAVTGSHQYQQTGIYTIVVSATGIHGAATTIRSPAVISAGPLTALGEDLEVSSATVANQILATFTDTRTGSVAGDYQATVDWGDGSKGIGIVSKLFTGQFVVRGAHTYRDAGAYAIDLHIHKSGDGSSNDAEAWSTASLSGFAAPPSLPPFPVVHLVAAWNSEPTKSITNNLAKPFSLDKETAELTGQIVLVDSGHLKSPGSKLRFWLSDPTGGSADVPLKVDGLPELTVGSIGSGLGISGTVVIALPKGQSGGRKNLLAQIIYSDPIIDASAVPKKAVSGPILPAIIDYGQSGSVTTRAGGTVTFDVILDTQPTDDVSVPIASSNTSEGTVSPSSLTFTSANWNTPQTVTLTGQADGQTTPQNYSVSVGPATSNDSLYKGVSGNAVSLTNSDSTKH